MKAPALFLIPSPPCIRQACTSSYCAQPAEAHELFASAAADGSARLWDLRTCRAVRSFSSHRNGQLATGLALSPCLRYLASGSEDQQAYLYDLRTGSVLHKVGGMEEEATAV